MVGSSSSSSSSCASIGSLDDVTIKTCSTVKFLCSYGGRILPCYPDGRLRYIGGETRVLAVDRFVSFSDLQLKLGELCGWETVNLRCQLPTDDLDALVSITSDEDLANLLEEYDLASRERQSPLKIRAFLHPTRAKSPKSATPPRTPLSLLAPSPFSRYCRAPFPQPIHTFVNNRCVHRSASPVRYSIRPVRSGGDLNRFYGHPAVGCSPCPNLVHHGKHWQ
ncbi:hypothetical protein AXF42_Ash018307 [Apostasia shenzhenica]|uniref:PB1 domain-containing protein n=1 Tax=Apostasia shenzhenica TaxID=1088818 RepID=A0A2I0B2S2_9ASPA|nr:hypothetical protein AXF42_Ash018307 [Apostasia shenzhenica]